MAAAEPGICIRVRLAARSSRVVAVVVVANAAIRVSERFVKPDDVIKSVVVTSSQDSGGFVVVAVCAHAVAVSRVAAVVSRGVKAVEVMPRFLSQVQEPRWDGIRPL